jgi:Lamin Tail Domain
MESKRAKQLGRRGRILAVASIAALAVASGAVVTPASAAGVNGIIISEVSPWGSGNSSYLTDWFEVTNTGSAAINITGWKMDDNSNGVPTSAQVALVGITSIAAGESVIFQEAASPATAKTAFLAAWFGGAAPAGLQFGSYTGSGVGLSSTADAVNLFDASGVLQANVSFGASPIAAPFASFDNAAGLNNAAVSQLSVAGTNGATLVASTPAAIGSPGKISGSSTPPTTTTVVGATTTTSAIPGGLTWPGLPAAANASTYNFGTNMSGLIEEPSGTSAPGVLWGVRNGVGTLFRMVWDSATNQWAPDSSVGWANGKALHYGDGTGDPDSEGVTYAGNSSANGIFVSTERNNSNNGVSKLSVLRFDPNVAGASLNATMEWNLTTDLPTVGANLGMEAITWVPDSYLTAGNFFDEKTNAAYNPANYANHTAGLFFIGIEGTGNIYAYALDQVTGGFTKIATIPVVHTPATVMELQFDRDLNELWAVCDNTCAGRHALLRLDPATGKFASVIYARPTGLPDFNNEGFAIGAAAECVGGFKPVTWADDNFDGNVALRVGTLPCSAGPVPVVPEFPILTLALLLGFGVVGAVTLRRRHLFVA